MNSEAFSIDKIRPEIVEDFYIKIRNFLLV